MSDYKKTLRLPKTKFPMKANLKQKEPEMLKFWEEGKAYDQMVEASGQNGEYILHDGPPYANGHIHMGTAMNKVLKDIIIKSRNMLGEKAQYVPGWDCHGLPIEHKVSAELKKKGKVLPTNIIRKLCREYALKWLGTQRKEFKRLGVFGTWEDPYMTLTPEYEAATARELGNFMKEGGVARGKKPIYWCCDCHTALAEAEVEYEDHTSPSIFVRFPIKEESAEKISAIAPEISTDNLYVVIWTTTPWTIPNNMAVALHAEFEYVFVKAADGIHILAEELLESCAEKFGWESTEILARTKGAELEGVIAKHPLYARNSPIVLADYVTLEAGTGCVHTAPGHGREDHETGLKYGLEVYSPLNDKGEYQPEVEFFAGMNIHDANPEVIKKLQEFGNLLGEEKLSHSYPHCWRCKEPVIYRATTQWFISMEANKLRDRALNAIRNDVNWIPAWGEDRIFNMIENRPDWCISRQRNWGVPITALICEDCDEVYHEEEWVNSIVDRFEKHETGCDYWFDAPLEEIVPEGLKCPKCGSDHWKRESDILDVWFDSGTSFAAVVEKRDELKYPADLYLEGSDQHRGWFHSSLLASMGTRDQAPYKSVLTHGYVVDKDGRKMSKSIGNVIAPQEIIDANGAEILRMWVSAVNYQEDVRISEEILKQLADAYRRIRNTCRFLLGNLADFNPAEHAVAIEDLPALDRYALDMLTANYNTIQDAYKNFEFHKVYHTLHNLCITDLSAFYLDIIKDRLYVAGEDSLERRGSQTVLWQTLLMLVRSMAPVMSFTAEEIFQFMNDDLKTDASCKTVFAMHFAPMSDDAATAAFDDKREMWEMLRGVRQEVTRAIEPLRRNKEIGHSLDTHITIYAKDEVLNALRENVELREYFIVSKVDLKPVGDAPESAVQGEELTEVFISVDKAPGEKCERCWRFDEELGTNADHATLCPRCTAVLEG
ncbi:MAG: isoleucine--tRNA ligase [Desulfovibrio sp.]